MLSRSEIERREEQFQYLQTRVGLPNGMKNPVVSMIIQCLDNDLSRRPKTQQLITMLEKIRVDTEGPHGDIVKMDAIRHVVTMRKLHKMNTEFKVRKIIILFTNENFIKCMFELLDHSGREFYYSQRKIR